jgi:hypothetical protein
LLIAIWTARGSASGSASKAADTAALLITIWATRAAKTADTT